MVSNTEDKKDFQMTKLRHIYIYIVSRTKYFQNWIPIADKK